jgi:predicted acetyltransferase
MTDRLILMKASPKWRSALLEMAEEYAAHGERRYQMALADCDGYLQRLAADDAGEIPPGRVRQTTYWGMKDELLVGVIRLRYELTPSLQQLGGHIGYDVRPSLRGRGYGTRMLALVLGRAQEAGLDQVMVTCDVDNIASARVIQKNGGVLQFQGTIDNYDKPIAHYWIQLTDGVPVRGEYDL